MKTKITLPWARAQLARVENAITELEALAVLRGERPRKWKQIGPKRRAATSPKRKTSFR